MLTSDDLPLVSVVVTTLNSERTLDHCLASIRAQNYPKIEIVVVDNFSADRTRPIARRFADQLIEAGPERCSQRNIGVRAARGAYVLIADSDMYFREDVVAAAVRAVEADIAGVTIPEESIGSGFWAACKSFERSFYVGDSSVTAARFFERDLYLRAGGFDENLVSGEDWDLSLRVGAMGRIATADTIIYHDEGHLQLAALLRKKFYYGCHIRRFMEKHGIEALKRISPLRQAYTRNLRKFFSNPSITFGMVFMRLCESAAGALGLIYSFVQTR